MTDTTPGTAPDTMTDTMNVFDRVLLRRRRDRAASGLGDHDFLFDEAAERLAARLDDVAPVERALRALVDAQSEFKEARLRLITLHSDHALPLPKGTQIEVTPAYEWLLRD